MDKDGALDSLAMYSDENQNIQKWKNRYPLLNRSMSPQDKKIIRKMREFYYLIECYDEDTTNQLIRNFFKPKNFIDSSLHSPLSYTILQCMVIYFYKPIKLPTMTQSFWRQFGCRVKMFFKDYIPSGYDSDDWLCTVHDHRGWNGSITCKTQLLGDEMSARFYKPIPKNQDQCVYHLNIHFKNEYKKRLNLWEDLPHDKKFENRKTLKSVLFTFYCIIPSIIGPSAAMDILTHTLQVMDFDPIRYHFPDQSLLMNEIRLAGWNRCMDRIQRWVDKARRLPFELLFEHK